MITTKEIGVRSKVVFNTQQIGSRERALVAELHEKNKDRYPLTILEVKGPIVVCLKDNRGNTVYPVEGDRSITRFELRWLKQWTEEE